MYYYVGVMRSLVKSNFVLLAMTLAGCTSYLPVTIGISNRGGLPVQGASVTSTPLYFFNPSSKGNILAGSYEILEPFPAKGDGGETNVDGRITLNLTSDNPNTLTIYAEGFEPWRGEIAFTKQDEVLISAPTSETGLVVSAE